MSDQSVAAALRSSARLVVIEAPAGCGKTFQGSKYALDSAGSIGQGRVLILAHTHAAVDVFASRTRDAGRCVDIRTIDSLVAEIAGAYYVAIGLPSDIGSWVQAQKDGHHQLAIKVAALLRGSPMIVRSLVVRYPIVIFDEHQDVSSEQHVIAMACLDGGAYVRILGDPMQRIFGRKKSVEVEADTKRWEELMSTADVFDKLDFPHRWSNGSEPLGQWILEMREVLRTGGRIDLNGPLPKGVTVCVAENQSPTPHGGYKIVGAERKPIDAFVASVEPLLVLASQNRTVNALRAFFLRQLPIWEGHMRESLVELINEVQAHKGDAVNIAQALVKFLGNVATGFSPSAFGNSLVAEVGGGCVLGRRGKPAKLQTLGKMILDQPDHKGVARILHRLNELRESDPAFRAVKIDYHSEFWDAVRLGEFEDPNEGLAQITRRRNYSRPKVPSKAISTIHKAKGLECDHVIIMPCDGQHFGNSSAARSLLYVAMSRARQSLTFVISRKDPSPLFLV
jgi:DNA helicase-2/ATP-dependent DNA helicase PcrA